MGVGALGLGACSDSTPAAADGPLVADQGQPDSAPDLGVDSAPTPDQGVDSTPAPPPLTSAAATLLPILPLVKQSDADRKKWGVWQLGPGEPHQRRDDLGVDPLRSGGGVPSSLLYTLQLTDLHLCDEESPARTIELDGFAGKVSGGWRYQDAYSTQVLDAMVRKIRALDASRAIDFVFFTGDATDNCQYNELMWFHAVLRGGSVQPNSGDLEDPNPGADNDPHDAFMAEGLGTIPWYTLYGNHDGLIQGNLPFDSGHAYSLVTGDPTRSSVTTLQLTKTNPPLCHAISSADAPTPPRCVPTARKDLTTGSLTPDPNRRHLDRKQWLDLHMKAGGLPLGHGFDAMSAITGRGDYVVDPIPGVPLRLIGLDTCAAVGAEGSYSQQQIDSFLVPALTQAEADGVVVVVGSHHPTSGILLSGGAVVAALNACPNVVLHLVGHGHKNQITVHKGATVGLGYWEVQTCSLVDWPQQGRAIELVDNRDGSGELWLTMVDYETQHGPLGALAAASRFFALWEVHSGESDTFPSTPADRNVILPVLFPPSVATRLASLPAKPVESSRYTSA